MRSKMERLYPSGPIPDIVSNRPKSDQVSTYHQPVIHDRNGLSLD
jgi:hypothetical protein